MQTIEENNLIVERRIEFNYISLTKIFKNYEIEFRINNYEYDCNFDAFIDEEELTD